MLTLEIDNGVKYRFPNLIRNPSPDCKYFLLAYVEEGVEVWGSNAKWGCTSELMAYLELTMANKWRIVEHAQQYDRVLYLNVDIVTNPYAPDIFKFFNGNLWWIYDESHDSPHWRGVARIGYGDKIYETRGFRKIDPSKYLVRDCPFHSTNPNEALPIGMMGNTYCDKCMG